MLTIPISRCAHADEWACPRFEFGKNPYTRYCSNTVMMAALEASVRKVDGTAQKCKYYTLSDIKEVATHEHMKFRKADRLPFGIGRAAAAIHTPPLGQPSDWRGKHASKAALIDRRARVLTGIWGLRTSRNGRVSCLVFSRKLSRRIGSG